MFGALGVIVVRYSFDTSRFHTLLYAGLSRRTHIQISTKSYSSCLFGEARQAIALRGHPGVEVTALLSVTNAKLTLTKIFKNNLNGFPCQAHVLIVPSSETGRDRLPGRERDIPRAVMRLGF